MATRYGLGSSLLRRTGRRGDMTLMDVMHPCWDPRTGSHSNRVTFESPPIHTAAERAVLLVKSDRLPDRLAGPARQLMARAGRRQSNHARARPSPASRATSWSDYGEAIARCPTHGKQGPVRYAVERGARSASTISTRAAASASSCDLSNWPLVSSRSLVGWTKFRVSRSR